MQRVTRQKTILPGDTRKSTLIRSDMGSGTGRFFKGKGGRRLFLKVRREFMSVGEKGASSPIRDPGRRGTF